MHLQRTYFPRAAQAILGARRARQRTPFITLMARQLDEIAPGTVRVQVTPVTHDGRPRTLVTLHGPHGAVEADRDQHTAAHGLISRAFPVADWSRPRVYNARTGLLSVDEPTARGALALDSAEGAR